jgi:hypothetical protein
MVYSHTVAKWSRRGAGAMLKKQAGGQLCLNFGRRVRLEKNGFRTLAAVAGVC